MDKLVEFFKVLSDGTRLRILVLLFHKELCVCEMCEIMEETQPKISRHLAKLRDVGFVRDERQGQWIFYYLNLDDIVMKRIIETIVSNKERYPVLQKDIQRFCLKTKWCERKN
ncbi:metalloregulator ArsR/SmtB family transcription factor [Caldicoprobacter algeriensis]|uniref:ArsR/SmtB family transcription factor n=1 Tax=Caldicoprobacter algeriensis TaxID=699281 RepID=UPI00207A95BA|nr:metalloregulator ArsR/SmtB family transcription factor [Caldicoprobacter algeriensis]MCM8900652.1 metalloregulator ArsR/SmtB family transcription factor [Caldicoprobacter algeriensis]